jgi:preprotein translocase SecE subunit
MIPFQPLFQRMLMKTIVTYVRESLEELRQVRWPTQQQAVRLTVIVVAFIALTSIFFGLVDAFINQVIRWTIRV